MLEAVLSGFGTLKQSAAVDPADAMLLEMPSGSTMMPTGLADGAVPVQLTVARQEHGTTLS
jgi:hypothetical protein